LNDESAMSIEAKRYLVVGVFAVAIDFVLFNLFLTFFNEASLGSIISRICATSIAIAFAFFGHKHWSFRSRNAQVNIARQSAYFLIVNLVGMIISLICLWFTHFILGLDSQLADNISSYVFGLALSTLFKFFANRRWVFLAPAT
jgi:putative flippase GtrA